MASSPLQRTGDLFASPAERGAPGEFGAAFDGWLEARDRTVRLRSSQAVYRAMWGGFVDWCLAQQPVVRLRTLSVQDLQLFVASRNGVIDPGGDVSARHTWRLLHLIERVQRFVVECEGCTPNTAVADFLARTPAVKYVNSVDSGLPNSLSASDARELVVYLSHVRPRPHAAGQPLSWQTLRNVVSVATQLGGGLTPGDVRALTLDSVVIAGGRVRGLPWKISVPADGTTPARETPIAEWTAQLLRYWLAIRSESGIAGEWLFPSTRSGKPWSKGSQYGAVGDVLAAAGIHPVEGGSFRLRHTFALRQLRRGRPAAEVARWMGIVNLVEMERYQRILTQPVDVV